MDEETKVLEPFKSTGSRAVKVLLIIAGTISVGLGALGAVLPVLPTTPFLLLAAACYLRSSKRLYRWLLTNPVFGEYLRRYRSGEGLPLSVKIPTLILLWASLGASAVFAIPESLGWVRVVLLLVGTGVTIHICRIKTMR